jgi:acyl carrier protein
MTTTNRILTREQVHNVLWELAAKHSGQDAAQLLPTSRLIQDLGTDSLTVTELTMELEERLGVTLPEELLDNPNLTLGDIEEAVCLKCQ